MPLLVPEFHLHREHVGHAHGARRLFQSLPSVASQQQDWRGLEPHKGQDGQGSEKRRGLSSSHGDIFTQPRFDIGSYEDASVQNINELLQGYLQQLADSKLDLKLFST